MARTTPNPWRTARFLVEIPYISSKDLTPFMKEEVQKALLVRFNNPRNRLAPRLGRLKVKRFAMVYKNMPTDLQLIELKDEDDQSET